MTIDKIINAGKVPESFYNIAPGRAIFYASEDGVSLETRHLVLKLFEECSKQRENFILEIKVENISNPLLINCIVARRLNLGSLYHNNRLICRVDSEESVDEFVKEYFNLSSRDDEDLKFVNSLKVKPAPLSDFGFQEPRFTGPMLGMIVMRNPEIEESEKFSEKTPEQIADEDEIIQMILTYADKYKMEISREKLFPLTDGKFILTENKDDCKLVFTDDHEFCLKAGTNVILDITKLQKAFYLLLLAHPKGIEIKRMADYREELMDYYSLVLKKGNPDSMEKTIDNLLDYKDLGDKYKPKALTELISKLNSKLEHCILNSTSQLPFKVQNTAGLLHVDLNRKFLDWQEKEVKFRIKD